MRIAVVTDTYEDGISGGVVATIRFVEALRKRHVVTVVATGPPAPGKVVLPPPAFSSRCAPVPTVSGSRWRSAT